MLDRRYERILDKREKRQFEKEKLAQMNIWEKLEYLFTYYKIWLGIPMILGIIVYLGVHFYYAQMNENVLQIAIVDGESQEDEKLEEEIKQIIGVKDKTKHVEVNRSIKTNMFQWEAIYSTLIGAEAIDVVICPEEFYQNTKDDGYRSYMVVELNDWFREQSGIDYEPVYICLVNNSKHLDYAEKFIEYIQYMQ